MKCPGCQKNHRKKEGMTCTCGYKFIFDPSIEKNWTDNMFVSLLTKASHNETYYFTKNQLLSYARKKRSFFSYFSFRDFILPVIAGLVTGAYTLIPILGVAAGLLVLMITVFLKEESRQLTLEELDYLLEKWEKGGKRNKYMITRPSLHKPPPRWKEEDIYDYGISRLLIADEDILVDLLVKNNFHADQHTLVISETGYPEYLEKHVKKISKENPHLRVYLLHAAFSKDEGEKMKERVIARYNFPGENIIDLGLYEKNLPGITRTINSKPDHTFSDPPVDFIPFPFLSALLILSMESEAEFMEILDLAAQGEFDNPMIAGDFG